MNYAALSTHINKHPCEGGKFVRVPCNFNIASSFTVDLSILLNMGGIQDLQTCFIDAADAADPVTVTVAATGQRIICPAGKQGFFPLFFNGDSSLFSIDCADANTEVTVFITNQPCIVPCVWPNQSSVPSSALRDSDGNVIYDSDGNPITGS